MNKRFKNILVKLIIIGSVTYITVLSLLPKATYSTKAMNETKKIENQIVNEIQSRSDIEIKKQLLQSKLDNAKMMVSQMDSDVEYILQTVTGEYSTTIDNKPDDDFADWLVDSKLGIHLQYKATVSIPAHKIETVIDKSGIVSVNYSIDDISVNAVEITAYNLTEDKKLFGHKYTKEETLAIIELSQDKIRSKINTSDEIKDKSANALEKHIKSIANKFKVSAVCFNNKYIENLNKYEFIDSTNVKYGHPNKYRTDDVKYIVIHSTANKNVDAEAHIKYLNTNQNSNAANYYIDYDSIQYALDMSMYPYHTGNQKNNNSIGIELCEFTDIEKQLQAIENAKDLIDILQEEFPDAELVFHHDVSDWNKNCPSIAFGNSAIYEPEELRNLLNMDN